MTSLPYYYCNLNKSQYTHWFTKFCFGAVNGFGLVLVFYLEIMLHSSLQEAGHRQSPQVGGAHCGVLGGVHCGSLARMVYRDSALVSTADCSTLRLG